LVVAAPQEAGRARRGGFFGFLAARRKPHRRTPRSPAKPCATEAQTPPFGERPIVATDRRRSAPACRDRLGDANPTRGVVFHRDQPAGPQKAVVSRNHSVEMFTYRTNSSFAKKSTCADFTISCLPH
jgi:hypothetical protein